VDVDKWDYLLRDCKNIGILHSYDYQRLLKTCRVIDNKLCYQDKEAYNLYHLFSTRYYLHKVVYSHHVSKAAEFMLCDALLAADKFLGISRSIHDPKKYWKLTDCILKQIECSEEPSLEPSRQIIERLRLRKFYKHVGEKILTPDMHSLEDITEEKLIQFAHGELDIKDIIIQKLTLNYSLKGGQNPVEKVLFYSKYTPNESFLIPKEKVSGLIPDIFEEKTIRLYVRDDNKAGIARRAFASWLKSRQGGSPTGGIAFKDDSPSPSLSLSLPPSPYLQVLEENDLYFTPPDPPQRYKQTQLWRDDNSQTNGMKSRGPKPRQKKIIPPKQGIFSNLPPNPISRKRGHGDLEDTKSQEFDSSPLTILIDKTQSIKSKVQKVSSPSSNIDPPLTQRTTISDISKPYC